jgi:hypothetical protein
MVTSAAAALRGRSLMNTGEREGRRGKNLTAPACSGLARRLPAALAVGLAERGRNGAG